jgi:hypothetical protein
MCAECHDRHRLPRAYADARPNQPCASCRGTTFVRVRALRERQDFDEGRRTSVDLLACTFEIGKRTTFTGRIHSWVDTDQPRGVISAFVCRSCGLTELYAHEPHKIPIGPEYATDLIDIAGQQPYR